ncbi:MAG: SPOR domain-containing protein [Chitinispirillia bacterium]|nr:SPOR domain-containing protein [Chitinispirillia bacterium]
MKRSLLIFMVLPMIAGCAASAGGSQYKEVESREPLKTVEAQSIEYTSSAKSPLTFIDTLNRGKEISLSEGDVAMLDIGGRSAAPARVEINEPRFRIQIMASGQIDVARQEKMRAESTTGLPVFLSSEQSLFKLYVGEFQTREMAEAALPDIRKAYKDAWIVRK